MADRWAWAEIDLGAIGHNLREIRKHVAPQVKLCAVVKANAYGHGALAVARKAVEVGADYLATATLGEALELRQAGFTTPLLILGLVPPEGACALVEHNITQTICDLELAKAISVEAQRQGKTAKVHLKVETGMGRIGVSPEAIGELAAEVRALPGIEIEGMFSHFAAADTGDKSFVQEQLAAFHRAIRAVEAKGIEIPVKHIAESAAILELPEAHFDMVRAGIIEYGLWPSDEVTHPIDLRPAMRLCARIAFIKTVPQGTTIGYGRAFCAKKESRIATLPIGYADGYIRAYAKHGSAEICGKRAPIAGRVCMDQVMVDITDIPEAGVGTEATLFGSSTLSTDEAAKWLDTINYEVTCMVSHRVPRVYFDSSRTFKTAGLDERLALCACEGRNAQAAYRI